jgi:hypothetical protein
MSNKRAQELIGSRVYLKLQDIHVLCFVERFKRVAGRYLFLLNPQSGKGVVWAGSPSFYVAE